MPASCGFARLLPLQPNTPMKRLATPSRTRRLLALALAANSLVVVGEALGGVHANSLAVLVDALHNTSDELALLLARLHNQGDVLLCLATALTAGLGAVGGWAWLDALFAVVVGAWLGVNGLRAWLELRTVGALASPCVAQAPTQRSR